MRTSQKALLLMGGPSFHYSGFQLRGLWNKQVKYASKVPLI